MTNREVFKFCPRCGDAAIAAHPDGSVHCPACGFVLFLNVATAAGAIIADDRGRVLLLRRSKEPGKGKLGAPGGFVDAGESVEHALTREVKEETGLQVVQCDYLCSFPNRYEYKGVTYLTADLFFVCQVTSFDQLSAMDETESCCFLPIGEINMDEIAFPTLRLALEHYRQKQTPIARSE